MVKSLNILGCGMVGTTLGLILRAQGFRINDVLTRTPRSAQAAVEKLGAGRAIAHLDDLRPAEVTMLTVNDDAIAPMALALSKTGHARAGDVFFHCSGATSAEALAPLRLVGGFVASLHPLKSFTDPAQDATTFAGTFCALDGDGAALSALRPVFEAAGARCTEIASDKKLLYHASAVFLSNYLHVLSDAALRSAELAGLDRKLAAEALGPLLLETAKNTLAKGPASALTGPIARGDSALVARQLSALEDADPALANLYRVFGRLTVEIAAEKGAAPESALSTLRETLRSDPKAGSE